MPVKHRCVFCGREFDQGFGVLYVKNDGSLLWFCSSKCRKNMLKLGRDRRKYKWAVKNASKS
ncbi:50S ribosomal protein L24e [Candidatus Bathyarchaeota archaeon ex4484_205]|nr:MAG: 50S ribosomal protein L24e [Candidatus Bathyarchaeota archaeon ex4484_205]HDN18361.1 50S ribosomal protein L24e [Candidatus Bathyarchaeota archaeon]